MRIARVALLITGLMTASLIGATAAHAAPSNDRLRDATTISSLPAIITENTSDAAGDGPHFCTQGNNSSVFFQFTPTVSGMLQADTFGSDYDTVLKVFSGTRNDFVLEACNDDFIGLASAVSFDASAGTTYYFMVQTCCRGSDDNTGGHLEFGLDVAPTADPVVALTVDGARLTAGHKVLVTGSVTCSQRTGISLFVILRQVRNDLYLARGSANTLIGCDPSGVTTWQLRVDSRTGVIFASGPATARGGFFAVDTAGSASGPIARTQVTIA